MDKTSNSELSKLDLKNLGNLIRGKRNELGKTQLEVAEALNLSSQHYSRIERGEFIPSLQTFLKIMDVLNIDMSRLNLNKGKTVTSTMYEIVTLLESFNLTQQKAVLTFLQTMTA